MMLARKRYLMIMSDKDILFLKPAFQHRLWGGDKLKTEWGYDIPDDHTGECWAVSTRSEGVSRIASGIYGGMTLGELWTTHPELFDNLDSNGGLKETDFPLLVKIIDAREDLSIQVHPNDSYAKEHENGSLGKTECWYVLGAEEGASLIVGHNAKTKGELESMIQEGRWNEFLRRIPVKPGDFLSIPPGTVHSITGGIQILEAQQNSDVTYRVYDYDRQLNGQPRTLHIKESIDVITVPALAAADSILDTTGQPANSLNQLFDCDYFRVWKAEVKGTMTFDMELPYMIMTVVEGSGTIDGVSIKKGDHFILPYGYGATCFEGDMTILASAAN